MESDEEYMSENILKISEKEDKNISRKTLREIKLYKKAKEENFKNSKRGRKVLAEEKRNEIMGTKIKEDNIGYKMLEKMGYKAGSAIGKKEKGLVEPIKIEVKRDRGGVGKQKLDKLKQSLYLETKKNIIERKKSIFTSSVKENLCDKEKRKDLKKIQRICRDLDMRYNITTPDNPLYWPYIKPPENDNLTTLECLVEPDNTIDPDYLDISQIELCLQNIWNYIKDKYFYCFWCGTFYSNIDEFNSDCPGQTKEDHD